MTEKELKALSRKNLIELLHAQSTEIELLTRELEKKRETLKNRTVGFRVMGSLVKAHEAAEDYIRGGQKAADRFTAALKEICGPDILDRPGSADESQQDESQQDESRQDESQQNET